MTEPTEIWSFDQVAAFHGHVCLDVALGYRVAIAALRELRCERPRDEELVAVVETDACAVDAIQAVTGCTFGKGNLVYRPFGKPAYTFVDRGTGDSVRIYCRFWEQFDIGEGVAFTGLMNRVLAGEADTAECERFSRNMAEISDRILGLPEDQLFVVVHGRIPPPDSARIYASAACARCGEWTMDVRLVSVGDARVCPPCHGAFE